MGKCLQVTYAYVTSLTGSTTFDAMTAGAGDSLNIPYFNPNTRAEVLEIWGGQSGHAGEFSLRSPNFADNQYGIRMAYQFNPTLSGADGDPQLLVGSRIRQKLYPSDTLTFSANGTASDSAAGAFLSYYEDLPGCDMVLRTWAQIEPLVVDYLGIRVSVTAGSSQVYGTALNFTSSDNRLVANTPYAILGASSQLPATVLAISGPATSNRRVGLPLHWNQRISNDWFAMLSDETGLPTIPVINGSDAAQYQLVAADAATNVATATDVQFAVLSRFP